MPVTISTYTLPNYHGPIKVFFYLFANRTFTPVGSPIIEQGSPDTQNKDWYQRIECITTGTNLTIPDIILVPTVNSDDPRAGFNGYLGDAVGNVGKRLWANYRIPNLNYTWEELRLFNIQPYNPLISIPGLPTFNVSTASPNQFLKFDDALNVVPGNFDATSLGTGTPDNTKFLRGDRVWAVPPGGGGSNEGPLVKYASDYATVKAAVDAITALGSPNCVLRITETNKPAGVLATMPGNVRIEFVYPGTVQVPAATTVTINSMENPGSIQCISLVDSTSHVKFGPAVDLIDVSWISGGAGVGGNVDRAISEIFASINTNGTGGVYFPSGTWSIAMQHVMPQRCDVYGAGKWQTIIDNTQTNGTAFMIGENIQWIGFRNLQLRGTIGETLTNAAVKCDGRGGYNASFIDFKSVVFYTNHRAFQMNDNNNQGFQVANVAFDKDCTFVANDIGIDGNTPNTNVVCEAFFQVNYIPQAGAVPGYSQWCGKFSRSGPLKFTGELAGVVGTYGHHQRQEITITSTDVITVAGTAIIIITAATLFGNDHTGAYAAGYGKPHRILVPLTTIENTANKISDAIRKYISRDPAVMQAFHVTRTYDPDPTLYPRINILCLDSAADDPTFDWSISANDVVGLTNKVSSIRRTGVAPLLPMGFEFTGGHYGMDFSTTDEGIDTLVLNNSDEIEGQLVFDKATIQGAVRLRKKCTMSITNSNTADKAIRNGGSDGLTFFGGSHLISLGTTVQIYSNFWTHSNNADPVGTKYGSVEVMYGRRVHNFGGITEDTVNNSIIGLETDIHDNTLYSNYVANFFMNPDAIAERDAWAGAINALSYNANYIPGQANYPLVIGNCNNAGRFTYGYGSKRDASGKYEMTGNQPGFSAFHFTNGGFNARGFIPDAFTPQPFTANTNNWNPTFKFEYGILRAQPSGANRTLTGILAPLLADGATISTDGYSGFLANVDTIYSLIITNEDAGSITKNRWRIGGGAASFTLGPGDIKPIYYDTTIQRWRIGSPVVASSGSAPAAPSTKSADYTTILGDANTEIIHSATDYNNRTFTIDSNVNVAYPVGTELEFLNLSANSLTIAITADTITQLGKGIRGSAVLRAFEKAFLKKVAATSWTLEYKVKLGKVIARIDCGRTGGGLVNGWLPDDGYATLPGAAAPNAAVWTTPGVVLLGGNDDVFSTGIYGTGFQYTFTGLEPYRDYAVYIFSGWNGAEFFTNTKVNGVLKGTLVIGFATHGVPVNEIIQGIYLGQATGAGTIVLTFDDSGGSRPAMVNGIIITE